MKKCAVISCHIINQYRRQLVIDKIKMFNKNNIDVILVSGNHIEKIDGVKNYLTIKNKSDKKYLSDGYFFFYVDKMKFIKQSDLSRSGSVDYKNFFIKMYQTVFNYCKNLEYDYCYWMDQDTLVNEKYYDVLFSSNFNNDKCYFYDLNNEHLVQLVMFHGNLNSLVNFFSEKNLSLLEEFCKTDFIYSNEQTLRLLINKINNNDIIILHNDENEIFDSINLISSNNFADIFFDKINKNYIFLQAKGDYCKNKFGAELYIDDVLLCSNTFENVGFYYILNLQPKKNYTIKYYEGEISLDTLSCVRTYFTDLDTICTNNYIEI